MRTTRIFSLIAIFACEIGLVAFAAEPPPTPSAKIVINADRSLGTVSPYLFGENLEYEHGAVSGGEQNMNHAHGLHTGGLWAEMLRDRKFEEGDLDKDGVANGWVPEERITNRYYDLVKGQSSNHRYRIDTVQYYGGGASQAINLTGDGREHASVNQVDLHFTKGERYSFYVYLKRHGAGSAWVALGNNDHKVYGHHDFSQLTEGWVKYQASFTVPETTDAGQLQIGVKGSGTFWIDSASLMPANNFHGMRADVIEATKPLKVPILRYPGGCFADTYHWRDGIGDRDKRPERWSDIWNEWEPNDFGFDDFMFFAHMLGFEPQITVNYMTGTPEEAAQWGQYANGSADTPMGKLRAQNGHPIPYHIKYWAVGNEVQQLCSGAYFAHNDVGLYAKRFEQYRSQIKAQDPSVEVFAVGAGPGPLQWNRDLLDRVHNVDALGVSIYTGGGGRIDDFDTKIMDLDAFYKHVVAEPLDFTRQLDDVIASIGNRMPDSPFIAVTEFQSWWLTEKVDEDLRLPDALYLGLIYNSLFRHAQQVRIAEIESLINVQGVVEVSQTSLKLTPEYFASLLYRTHTGETALATSTDGPSVEFDRKLAALDGMATLSSDQRTLYVAVVNRSEGTAIQTAIAVAGWKPTVGAAARVFELNGNNKVAANPFGSSENVSIQAKTIHVDADPLVYSFPAHSISILEVDGTK
ncbi:MAG: alpha-L-arabinofuranosidase C-terminal domain-containing protein [Acidobacteriaceae bacterium]